MKKKKKGRYLILAIGALTAIVSVAAYTTWNHLDPKNTCAQCHEVAPAHTEWMGSAHAGVSCTECHGTALSNGYHSLKEKLRMVYVHVTGDKRNEDIHLGEEQVLELSNRCISCHQSEHAGWLVSGHAVNYAEIFLDSAHNAMEKPYWDCFRCHGMFYDGNIHDLMELEGDPHEWTMRHKRQELRPTVPCLACHQIHTENPLSARYVPMTDTLGRPERHPRTALYMRADKMYLRSDRLTRVVMMDGDREVLVSDDPSTLLCMQCHAPNFLHHAGSEDDRTPVGVHEGIGCITCHKPHSGDTRESCVQCHPAMSNCGLDVMEMNTTFRARNSPNDIHRISCASCHVDGGGKPGSVKPEARENNGRTRGSFLSRQWQQPVS